MNQSTRSEAKILSEAPAGAKSKDPLARLAPLLRQQRRKHRLSLNQLAKATGISRRTLARIESGHYGPIHPERSRKAESKGSRRTLARIESGFYSSGARGTKHGARQLSPRIGMRLAKALLPLDHLQATLADATRLSRSLGSDPLYKLLDSLYHYPAFLFHDSPVQRVLREEFGSDYRHSLDLLLRSGFGTRNLGRRLRAFRLQHDLTQQEVAELLALSNTHVAALEAGSRHPSPRVRFKLLRLVTLPLPLPPPAGRPFRGDISRLALSRGGQQPWPRAGQAVIPTHPFDSAQGKPARGHRNEPAGETPGEPKRAFSARLKPCPAEETVGEPTHSFDSAQGKPASGTRREPQRTRSAGLEPAPDEHGLRITDHESRITRQRWLGLAKLLLALPPPEPIEFENDPHSLHRLRYLWLASNQSTRELAAAFGISQPHLIRLLRGDRRPSRKLRERIAALAGSS